MKLLVTVAVSNQIRNRIQDLFQNWGIGAAPDLAPTIVSYAQPKGRELFSVFPMEDAQKLFPKQFPILCQFGLYKSSSNKDSQRIPEASIATVASIGNIL